MSIPANSFILINGIIILLFVFSIYQGYKKGLIYQLLSLISFAVAFIVAWILSPIFAKYFVLIEAGTNYTDILTAALFNQVAWFVIVLILAKLIFDIILQLSKIVSKIPLIGFANRLLGACFGLVGGLLWTVLLSTLFMTPIFENGQEVRDNTILKYVNDATNKLVLYVSENIDLNQLINDKDLNNQINDIDNYRDLLEQWLLEEGILD